MTVGLTPASPFSDYTTYMLAWLKCQFEYQRGNGKKCLKLLSAAPTCPDDSALPFNSKVSIPYFSFETASRVVKACGLFQLRKFNTAAAELIDAWDELDSFCQNTATGTGELSLKTLNFAGPAYSAIGYNMACCLLHAGKYLEAFEGFMSTLSGVKHLPQTWLHIAECCIQIHEQMKNNPLDDRCRLSLVGNSFGNGIHRKIPIAADFLTNNEQQEKIEKLQQHQQQKPSLEFASACLSNCLMLVGQYRALSNVTARTSVSDDQTSVKTIPFAPGLPMTPVLPEVLDAVQSHALLSLTYVSLCLNNFNLAVRAGTDLLALGSKLSPRTKYLGHLYMAEALINVDRIPDAVGYISASNLAQDFDNEQSVTTNGRTPSTSAPNTPRDPSVDSETQSEQQTKSGDSSTFWPSSQASAQGVLSYNLAATYATRGDLERSLVNLETVSVLLIDSSLV